MPVETPTAVDLTGLLFDWSHGDASDADRLFPIVYGPLRKIAERMFRGERGDHTLQPTAVVHEAYLRLAAQEARTWVNREHFFAVSARTMRRLLIDHARRRGRAKRGAGVQNLSIEEAMIADDRSGGETLFAVEEALRRLARLDSLKAQIVVLRCFGGFSIAEAAEAIGRSEATVNRHWRFAKAWMAKALSSASDQGVSNGG